MTGIAGAFGGPYGGGHKGDFEKHPHASTGIGARNAGKLLRFALGAQHYETLAGLGFRV